MSAVSHPSFTPHKRFPELHPHSIPSPQSLEGFPGGGAGHSFTDLSLTTWQNHNNLLFMKPLARVEALCNLIRLVFFYKKIGSVVFKNYDKIT